MAAAIPYVAAAFAGASAIQQYSAGREAERASERNAAAAAAEAAEEERRLRKEQREREATTKARAAAGGASASSGSAQAVMSDMQKEHQSELAWLRKSGASRVRSELDAGKQAKSQATSAALGTLSSAVAGFGS
tara:strand:- start:8167 stop:8568 length:402 start_codon:yes stop_codon:yes gene_type:complete